MSCSDNKRQRLDVETDQTGTLENAINAKQTPNDVNFYYGANSENPAFTQHQLQNGPMDLLAAYPKQEVVSQTVASVSPSSLGESNSSSEDDEDEEESGEEDEGEELARDRPKENVFVTVSGRLSLMGNGGKYDKVDEQMSNRHVREKLAVTVTMSEIRRRVGPPECLNSSILAAMLRKAKTANNGKGMREELTKVGIELPVGRRKQGVTTALSALLEGEATHLATDLDKVTAAHYPINTLTEHFCNKFLQGPPQHVETRRRDLIGAVRILREIGEVLYGVQCPLGDHNPPAYHDPNLQLAFNHYSLITHGFGVLNQRTWIRQFCTLAEQVIQSMNTHQAIMQQQQQQHSTYTPPPNHMDMMQNGHPSHM